MKNRVLYETVFLKKNGQKIENLVSVDCDIEALTLIYETDQKIFLKIDEMKLYPDVNNPWLYYCEYKCGNDVYLQTVPVQAFD